MATLNIVIPTNFSQQLNQFMVNVQKMQQLTQKFVYTSQNLPAGQNLFLAHRAVTSRFSQLLLSVRKLNSRLLGVNSILRNSLGALGQNFLRGLSLASEALGPILSTMFTVGSLAISLTIKAFSWGTFLAKWLWDKFVGLGDSILQDHLVATGAFATIGGIRAFRIATGGLPDDPNILPGMVQARGNVTSLQLIALKTLRINASHNTADMMLQATIAAARFMKHQAKGLQLRTAAIFGITSLISPERLVALENLTEEELRELEQVYERYKPLMEITAKARKGWINFTLQVQATGAQIISIVANELANPKSPFVQALTELSKSIGRFFKVVMETPAIKEFINRLGKYIDEFADWLTKPENIQEIKKLIRTIGEIVKSTIEAIRLLKQIIEDWTGTTTGGRTGREFGRRSLAQRLKMDRPGPRPTTEIERYRRPTAPAEVAKIKYPGRARFHEKVGMPTRHGEAQREAAKRTVRTPPGLRAPSKPEEAPETTEAATKGGFARGGGKLDRSWAAQELREKPWLRDKILRIAANEQGSNPEGTQAVLESMMNRAEVRGTSLEAQAKWVGERGYYAQGNMGRGALENPQHRAVLERSLSNTLAGGNVSNYATDNASQGLAQRRAAADPASVRRGNVNGETFFSPPPDQLGNRKKYQKWYQDQISRPQGGVAPWSVEDIKNMDKGDLPPSAANKSAASSDAPAFTGDGRLTTVGNYRLGGDPRRSQLVQAATEASKNLPEGWRVEAYSGQRDGARQGPHAHAGAIDFRLIDPSGKEIPNYKNPENFRVYERFAQDTHFALQKINPGLAAQHRWGGYFSGSIAPDSAGGKYGAMDLMHQDFDGGDGRMAAGQWKTGLNPEWRQRWGVNESVGLSKRLEELEKTAKAPQQQTVLKIGEKEFPMDPHPIKTVKIDNRSDHDISEAKSSSDHDPGEAEPAEDLTK
jgi:hypothetical protein